MAGGYQAEDGDAISEINVTPLVDVVLVLLIIFMVTAPLIAARGIKVNSPSTVSGSETTGTVKVSVNKEGKVFINGELTEPSAVRPFLEQARAEKPDLQAVIDADEGVPYGAVMEVIDSIKLAGVSKFALASKRKKEQN